MLLFNSTLSVYVAFKNNIIIGIISIYLVVDDYNDKNDWLTYIAGKITKQYQGH